MRKIKSIKKIRYSGNVYNLTVADCHNYFVNESILVGNCHGEKAKELKAIAEKCTNAEYRIGFTGSMPKEQIDYMTIQAGLGPKLIKISSEELIDRGVLSQIAIANILIRHSSEMIENCKGRTFPEEVRLLKECEDRKKIFKWIFNNIPDGQNSLILVEHLDTLSSLKEYLEKNLDKKYNIRIIKGAVKTEDREKIRKETENEENVIIIATYKTMSVGINIKKLHNIIFGSPRKSFISIVQSIGRGLRVHETKDKLVVFDIIDDLTYERQLKKGPRKGKWVLEKNYYYQQFEERLEIYKEQKFEYFTKKIDLSQI